MKPVILTLISEKELPQPSAQLGLLNRILTKDPRVVYLKRFTAVNVKFAAYDRGFGKVIDQAGCERHAWEYLEMRSLEQAEKLAKKLAAKCFQHKIKVFNANAEAGTSGTDPYPPYSNPYYVLQHFVKVFRLCAPSYTELWYNGWSWSVTGDGRRLHDAPLISLFDAWCPMNYGTTAEKIEENWEGKCFKYSRRLPDLRVIPMLGVGRIDDKGKTWGFWSTHRRLLTSTPVSGVSFYFGNGAKPQMLIGNKKHPALLSCVQDLRDAPGWEE
jgi:hypothetical protein